MCDRDELRPVRQPLLELLDMEHAQIVNWHPDQFRALPLADEMPRHDVGMMLHDRDDDLVALADFGMPKP